MKGYLRTVTLLVVSISVLSGCNGRRILHGTHGKFRHRAQSCASHPQSSSRNLTIWFVRSAPAGLKLVSVTRKSMHGDRVHQAVQELLDGPDEREERSGLGSEIPRGTILLGLTRKANDIELNLSRRFASGGGSTSFLTRLEQLKKTIAEPAGSSNVYLSVEGHRLNVEEGEGIEIHQPINR